MSLALRALRTLATSVAVLVGGLALVLLLAPRLLGWQLETVLSGSMTPTLGVGSVAAIEPVDPAAVRPGDVITYRDGDHLTTHRVVDVHAGAERSFVTKGDANEDNDPTAVEADAVVGRVLFDVPLLGHLTQLLRDPLAFLLLAALPGMVFVFLELRSLLLRWSTDEAPEVAA